MIAAGRSDHAARPLRITDAGEQVDAAAHLERADGQVVLVLDEHVEPPAGRQQGIAIQRGAVEVSMNDRPRAQHILKGHRHGPRSVPGWGWRADPLHPFRGATGSPLRRGTSHAISRVSSFSLRREQTLGPRNQPLQQPPKRRLRDSLGALGSLANLDVPGSPTEQRAFGLLRSVFSSRKPHPSLAASTTSLLTAAPRRGANNDRARRAYPRPDDRSPPATEPHESIR